MTEFEPLTRRFYEPSAEAVAPALLGHFLLRQTPAGAVGGPIVETEAYMMGDPACHGYIGLTPRNRALFGHPGYSYVYFIYGCHFCVNAVCRPEGSAEAVLIRAIEPLFGVEQLRVQRHARNIQDLTNGPGKLCQALRIDRTLDAVDLCDKASQVFIAKNPGVAAYRKNHGGIEVSPRIGITKAASLPLRFFLPASGFISRGNRELTKPGAERGQRARRPRSRNLLRL